MHIALHSPLYIGTNRLGSLALGLGGLGVIGIEHWLFVACK